MITDNLRTLNMLEIDFIYRQDYITAQKVRDIRKYWLSLIKRIGD